MQAAATGISTNAARASETASSRFVVDERTSNQASHTRSAAVAAATPLQPDRASRRADRRRDQEASEGGVEPGPGEGVVVSTVLRGKRDREHDRPRDEPDSENEEDRGDPPWWRRDDRMGLQQGGRLRNGQHPRGHRVGRGLPWGCRAGQRVEGQSSSGSTRRSSAQPSAHTRQISWTSAAGPPVVPTITWCETVSISCP